MTTSLTYIGSGTQTAPGVYTSEIIDDVTAAGGASSTGAIAGLFSWGPVNSPTLVASEDILAMRFGQPSNFNAETWFSAANFLAYGNALYVVRVADTTNTVFSATANTANVVSQAIHTVENQDDYDNNQASFEAAVNFIAKYPGTHGTGLKVSVCGSAAQYQQTINFANVAGNTAFAGANTGIKLAVGSNTATVTLANSAPLVANTPLPLANTIQQSFNVGDLFVAGNTSVGTQTLKITSVSPVLVSNTAGANTGGATFTLGFDQVLKMSTNVASTTATRKWEFSNIIGTAPTGVDGMHLVVVDTLGSFKPAGTVLEAYVNLSRATDAVGLDGTSTFYKTALNKASPYLWVASAMPGFPTGTLASLTAAVGSIYSTVMQGGTDGPDENTVPISIIAHGWDLLNNKILWPFAAAIVGTTRGGNIGEQIFNYVIDNLGEARQDIAVYGSPARAVSVNNSNVLNDTVTFRSNVRYSSYGFMDSGYAYQYDKYNDVNRWIPLCGGTAGISCRSDVTNNPWTSPAGINRGQYLNLIRLSYNPSDPDRTVLDANDVNAVISVQGEGTFLYGDKTLIGQQTALNQIGTRKMFNVFKTVLAAATRGLVFEFNDEFTQNQFKSIVEPTLRDAAARRGLTYYSVVCDSTNNTQDIVQQNRFVGDIYLTPARSIRVAQLNFVAVGNASTFVEASI